MRQFDFLPTLVTPFDVRRTRKRVPAVLIDAAPLVCLCINSEWASHVSGVIERLLYEDVWLGTDEEIDFAIHEIERFLATMSCFDCGGNDPPPQYRYNDQGRLEKSTDGGQTWNPADAEDPRFNSPIFPPLPPDTPDATRCRAAENAKIAIHDMVDQFIAEGATWAGIAGATAALLALLFVFITLGAATPAVVGLAAAILSAGVTAIDAAFTPAVYTTLRCILYCACKDDGSWDAAAWEQVKSEINAQFTGVVHSILSKQIDALGPAGLTNAGRTDISGPVSCNDCTDCPQEWCYTFDFTASDGGWAAYGAGASYAAGTGWRTVAGVGGYVAYIQKSISQTTTVTSVKLEFAWDSTPPRSNGFIKYGAVNRTFNPGNSPQTASGLAVNPTLIQVAIGNGSNQGNGTGTLGEITRVTVTGTGVNPFGTDNCPPPP